MLLLNSQAFGEIYFLHLTYTGGARLAGVPLEWCTPYQKLKVIRCWRVSNMDGLLNTRTDTGPETTQKNAKLGSCSCTLGGVGFFVYVKGSNVS